MVWPDAGLVRGRGQETTVGASRNRPCTQLNLGVNERVSRARAAGGQGLFDYAARETAGTVYWEAVAVGVLILCSWGLCVLVVLR